MNSDPPLPFEIGLHAAVVSISDQDPVVLTVNNDTQSSGLTGLPYGPFDPENDRTLEAGLRRWVGDQTRLRMGYVEQLYTFGDRGRQSEVMDGESHFISVGYLALVRRIIDAVDPVGGSWSSWYSHFPWEDWRNGPPELVINTIIPSVLDWLNASSDTKERRQRRIGRFQFAFSADPETGELNPALWDEERVLERYELMYEAGLVSECVADGRRVATRVTPPVGKAMIHDHRRILATAIARLRGKLKYRPVVFELMAEEFTLTDLQRTIEMLSGKRLHKQNFRRMVDSAHLVEPTGRQSSETGGRPAALYRYRPTILRERPHHGLRY